MKILSAYHRPCIIGIGGVSTSALAEMLKSLGFEVFGTDWNDSARTRRLVSLGIPVHIGPNNPHSIDGADVVIRTAAAHDDAPEIVAARAQGIPVMERAAAWADVMREYRQVLCLSGCHGKSSTTGMCAAIGIAAELDPTVSIGADLSIIGGNLHIGGHEMFVAEADEYYNSFLNFPPTVAVVNNIEFDHPDFYPDLDAVLKSFNRFIHLVPSDGTVVVNADNENACRATADADCRILRFGLDNPADVTARDLHWDHGCGVFTLMEGGEALGEIRLQIPGIHNVYNALASAAGTLACGVAPAAVIAGLNGFTGVDRRFERKGTFNGAVLVDDYAHHPTELKNTLATARSCGYERVICAFQPHTYSRTKLLFDDFAEALKLADVPVLTEIYAAREQNTENMTSKTLADAVGGVFCESLADTAAYLRSIAREGDLIIMAGAGSILEVTQMLLS